MLKAKEKRNENGIDGKHLFSAVFVLSELNVNFYYL
jgi:hypothetical protein